MNPDAAVYLGTFAAIAFVLKSAILLNIEIRDRISQCFVVLCLFMVIQNAAEFLGYFTYLRSSSLGEFFIHVYMISLYFIFPSVYLLALALTDSPRLKQLRLILYACSLLLTLIHISGLIISGFIFLGWSVITEPGTFLLGRNDLCGCGASDCTITHLFHAYRTTSSAVIRHNARINLLAFTPIIIVALAVLGLRILGFNSSSAVSLPVATLIFLYVMLLHTSGKLFWFSTKLKSVVAILKMDRRAPIDEITGGD